MEGRFLHNQTVKEGPLVNGPILCPFHPRCPLIEIEMIYHRNDLLYWVTPGRGADNFRVLTQAAQIKRRLRRRCAGRQRSRCLEPGVGDLYRGQYRTNVSRSCPAGRPDCLWWAGRLYEQVRGGRYQIDVTDMEDVLWAMSTRSDRNGLSK